MRKEFQVFSENILKWRNRSLNALTMHYFDYLKTKYENVPDKIVVGDELVSKSSKKEVIANLKIGTPIIEGDVIHNNIYQDPIDKDAVHDALAYEILIAKPYGPFKYAKINMTVAGYVEKALQSDPELPRMVVRYKQ